uniref:NADH-ubiquinone oxidoreductase chain 4L n=1 Tax=Cucujoidea sp. 4 KM-2017 TaxID=2219378 RepID=A0A346RFY8_9CUCU|nr:NADH dehydrogenase subunit 4L [Cucujoidea sp. 4 KM-2017]
MKMLFILLYNFFMGLLSFSINRKHLLLMLMSMEFIILILYFSFFLVFYMFLYEYFFSMFFLIMSVCESVLGLSLLIKMIRSYGNDNFNTFNSLW